MQIDAMLFFVFFLEAGAGGYLRLNDASGVSSFQLAGMGRRLLVSPAKCQNKTSSSPGCQEKKAGLVFTIVGNPIRPKVASITLIPRHSSSETRSRRFRSARSISS